MEPPGTSWKRRKTGETGDTPLQHEIAPFPFGLARKTLVLLNKNGAPGAIRTRGPQIRNLMLYPAELRVPADGSIAREPRGQFFASGGTTGNGKAATSTPSAIRARASSGATSPWMLALSCSP